MHTLLPPAGEQLLYGDSKGEITMLLCGTREWPARDLIATEEHQDYITVHREHTDWVSQVCRRKGGRDLVSQVCFVPGTAGAGWVTGVRAQGREGAAPSLLPSCTPSSLHPPPPPLTLLPAKPGVTAGHVGAGPWADQLLHRRVHQSL